MIVLDASVVVDLLLDIGAAPQLGRRLRSAGKLYAPHLLDAEVGQVIRRQAQLGRVSASLARVALQDLLDLPLTRFPHEPLVLRAFELRDNLTFYDALNVALAEALEAPLLTRDAELANAPGHQARIELVSG